MNKPAEGASKQSDDHRAAKLFGAFFKGRKDPNRPVDPLVSSPGATDWDGFIQERRSGRISIRSWAAQCAAVVRPSWAVETLSRNGSMIGNLSYRWGGRNWNGRFLGTGIFDIVFGRGGPGFGTMPAVSPSPGRASGSRELAIALVCLTGIAAGCASRHEPPPALDPLEASPTDLPAATLDRPRDAGASPRARAQLLLDRGRWEEVRPILQESLRLNPDDPEMLNSLGWVELSTGNAASAVPLFEKAIALHPTLSPAHFNLPLALHGAGRPEAADSAYRSIIEVDPQAAMAHGGLAWLLLDSGRMDEAEREFREAIRLDPKHATNHRGLGNLLMAQQRLPDALASFRTAVHLTPDDARLWVEMGVVTHLIGHYAESAAAFERASRIKPSVLEGSPRFRGMWQASQREEPYVPGTQ